MEVEEPGWTRMEYHRPRNMPNPWRRRDQRDGKRERNSNTENRRSQVKPKNNVRREDRKCQGCGKTGHMVAQCPRTRCFECGTEGHIARQCPYMYRRRKQNVPGPMEVNARRLRRRVISRRTNGSMTESTEMSETSGTETEAGDHEREDSQQGKRSSWRRKGEAAGHTRRVLRSVPTEGLPHVGDQPYERTRRFAYNTDCRGEVSGRHW
ncbi:uncharacterized protein [Halyomorpha halys]|uniref:uncharacterized protein n=1 Tax=Halyomorpha halys TaxID=286706 RepID=UPI000D0C75D5|nr:serine/arginine-rich splicing factor RS2Z32-like [Halyomorpha halys]